MTVHIPEAVFGPDETPGARALSERQRALHRTHGRKLLTDRKWLKTATPDAKAWALWAAALKGEPK